MNKEKQLTIALLTEKLQKLTNKKVIIKENIEESNTLKVGIQKAIAQVDDSLSYEDFAIAVADVIKDDYGTHNIKPFLDALQKALKV